MTTTKPSTVRLIPWDFASTDHQERAYQQRVTCGWRWEEIQMWVDLSRRGQKTLYWLVLAEDVPNREAQIAKNIAEYSYESTPLADTAPQAWLQPRTPSCQPFHPIGHVALDKRPEEDAHLGLSDSAGVVWIAGLFVSPVLQGGGYGRAAMREVERVAAATPPGGRIAVLDTVAEAFQLSGRYGTPVPKITNEAWYRKQGYEEFHRGPGYRWLNPATGERGAIPVIFFQKQLGLS